MILMLVLLLISVLLTVLYAVAMYKRREAERRAEEELHKAEGESMGLDEEAQRKAEARHQTEESQQPKGDHSHRGADETQPKGEAPSVADTDTCADERKKYLHDESRGTAEAQCQIEELQQLSEEERHIKADEAQRKEEQRQKSDEKERRAEEKWKRLEQEKSRKRKRVPPEVETKKGQLEPVKRGGRPRGFNLEREGQPSQETPSRCPKPEIICWKKGRRWILGVEIPDELPGNSSLVVLQNGSPLKQEGSGEACWLLKGISGEVVVRRSEGQGVQETRVALGQDGYLLFKLSSQDQNQGRRVKSLSSGSYLVVVPDNWDRDDTLSGPPPVAPESVSLTGYQAHFFEVEKDGEGKIAFRKPTGESFEIKLKAQRFELVGNQLCDATENIGPLFGEKPPQIRTMDKLAWEDIRTIIVGEEGSGKGRWRKAFYPNPEVAQQDLPSEIEDRRGGWYFLRFYNTNDDLVESLDFRFLCALKKIKVLQPSPFPSEDGHRPVCIEFLHEPGCLVRPIDRLTNIQIEPHDDKTTLTIPPDSTYDETRWIVGPKDGPQVEVTILVERLWWSVGEEHNAPSEWKDQPLTLARDDFAATSKKALWLRLPRRRWVDEVRVGFEQPNRLYKIKVTEKTIAVPLREFGDSKEVGDRTQEYSLKVWIERDGKFMEGVVAIIPASVVAPEAGPVVSPPPAHYVGLGRKKTAVAKAVLQPGFGDIKVNGRPHDDYFKETPRRAKQFLRRLLELKQVRETLSHMDVLITVTGSSPITTRQAKAVAHAIARALMSYDPKLKPLLKQAGFEGSKVKKFPAYDRRIINQ